MPKNRLFFRILEGMKTSLYFLFLIVFSGYLSQQNCSKVGRHGFIDNTLTQQIEFENIWFEIEVAQYEKALFVRFNTKESNKEVLERLGDRLKLNGLNVSYCDIGACIDIVDVPLDSILPILSKK